MSPRIYFVNSMRSEDRERDYSAERLGGKCTHTHTHTLASFPCLFNFIPLLLCPGASLHTANRKYFWFHHSEGDTMSVQDPLEMNLCSALWAVVAFVVADLEDMLPR